MLWPTNYELCLIHISNMWKHLNNLPSTFSFCFKIYNNLHTIGVATIYFVAILRPSCPICTLVISRSVICIYRSHNMFVSWHIWMVWLASTNTQGVLIVCEFTCKLVLANLCKAYVSACILVLYSSLLNFLFGYKWLDFNWIHNCFDNWLYLNTGTCIYICTVRAWSIHVIHNNVTFLFVRFDCTFISIWELCL